MLLTMWSELEFCNRLEENTLCRASVWSNSKGFPDVTYNHTTCIPVKPAVIGLIPSLHWQFFSWLMWRLISIICVSTVIRFVYVENITRWYHPYPTGRKFSLELNFCCLANWKFRSPWDLCIMVAYKNQFQELKLWQYLNLLTNLTNCGQVA